MSLLGAATAMMMKACLSIAEMSAAAVMRAATSTTKAAVTIKTMIRTIAMAIVIFALETKNFRFLAMMSAKAQVIMIRVV